MDNSSNNINESEIRELLKWRLLKQVEGNNDDLNQKLIEMEAKLVFSNEALLVPSLQKEKELLQKLATSTIKNKFLKWTLLSILSLLLVASVFYFYSTPTKNLPRAISLQPTQHEKINISVTSNNSNNVEKKEVPIVVKNKEEKVVSSDSTKPFIESQINENSIEKIEENKPNSIPKEKVVTHASGNIPLFTEKQIVANNKFKEKMIKALVKKDKSKWAYIPMGSDLFYGNTVSVNCFYMATEEVTNKEYMTFLNDLVINNKIEEYKKALPDTTKWIMNNIRNDGYMNNYLWHPAYANFPVVNVSRDGAQMYCVWLTEKANKRNEELYLKSSNSKSPIPNDIYMNDVRLPDELEWMMAARGGNIGAEYPWGTNKIQNENGCFLCNFKTLGSMDALDSVMKCPFNKNGISAANTILNDIIAPVNSYNPNLYGLYCMSGNVAEMVWRRKVDSNKKVLGKDANPGTKGGSWNSDYHHTKISAADEYEGVVESSPYIGFRPVFTATKCK